MAFAHGTINTPPLPGFVESIKALGFPAPELFAWAAGLSELLGGICIAVGLGTRINSIILTITMAVAVFARHHGHPFYIKEIAAIYLACAVFFAFSGAGKYSLDRFLSRRQEPSEDLFKS
jgi:putative oxidoreductase